MNSYFETWAIAHWVVFFGNAVARVNIFCRHLFYLAPSPDVLMCTTAIAQTLTPVVLLAASPTLCAV